MTMLPEGYSILGVSKDASLPAFCGRPAARIAVLTSGVIGRPAARIAVLAHRGNHRRGAHRTTSPHA
jgi:hypothetical protein